ncbi:tetratricopeptide repeat protein [Bacillus swezeyi]|uniref:Aspartate phosphatase n=1 Tax=Bacillus swezeyi TaxID=1925020 RepID=A0A1R1QYN4_9BACI|nr:Rap family tetratricopeptide repeat protein [Bacillus swezeyi]MEC1262366.1 tetratricopeptide repeat protein [Bacillus swezeyi]MED2926925.1 tetratricopeptide repeat protein [Bacillus swezeyi]MED2965513.1 tetratricopeptide repeat protein [Bacillus swezeyi]MED3071084.1 tetratricopeptide repeat protein [Bacillus swezeyi]MED3083207.1 tetratricopeptide repeat protein [Bacillus swezeyi]
MDVIPYDLVATKMNFWYTALKNNWPGQAEDTRKEVERELDQMEQNQDVVVYYNLLLFRHNLQFDYMYSDPGGNLNSRFEEFKKIRDQNNLEGMLEYYYQFFAGMYHFRQKELILALNFYRNAEKQLDFFDCDELEKAEFYFKTSEVYYHMKQTFFSMNYATQAYNIYKKYDTYGERRVQCQFILAGNCRDQMLPEKAIPSLNQALNESNKIASAHLIGSSHLNLGICYNQLEELEKASNHLQKTLEVYREVNHSFLSKALFNLAHVRAKQAEWVTANDLYFDGKESAEKSHNAYDIAKLEMLKGLYLIHDLDLVRESFKFFKENGLYADVEDYGIIAGEILETEEKIRDACEFYRIACDARRQIQRSGYVNES